MAHRAFPIIPIADTEIYNTNPNLNTNPSATIGQLQKSMNELPHQTSKATSSDLVHFTPPDKFLIESCDHSC